METTDGTLLGGRIPYRQPEFGYRTGIEPVLLAAHCPARAGDRVIEAGCGAGAGLLCLLARVPGVLAEGIEIDPGMAALARDNTGVTIHATDIAGFAPGPVFHHAFANPPWHDWASTPSVVPRRALAKRADAALIDRWLHALVNLLRPRGTATVLIPAGQFARAAGAMHALGMGAVTLTPLWPRLGRPARLVMIRATRGARGPDQVQPGLILHHDAGFSDAAQAILRDGGAL